MEYSKVQHSFARTATFKGSDPASKGVWLSLHVYCGDQENGGVVRACKAWSDRQWYAAIDASRAELEAAIAQGMARWEDDDLHLNSYDTVGEAAYQVARELNREKANTRWAKHRGDQPSAPVSRGTVPSAVPPAPSSDAGGMPAAVPGAVPPAMPIPVHSIPGHSRPHTPTADAVVPGVCVGGAERIPSKEENTAALERLLVKLTCATGPGATPRWAGVAMQAKVRNQAEALECIEWLIKHTRAKGVPVQYASDVLPFLEAWGYHKEDERRRRRVGAA